METPTDIDSGGRSRSGSHRGSAAGPADTGGSPRICSSSTDGDGAASAAQTRSRLSARVALGVFIVYVAAAFVLVPLVIGRQRWFELDEWHFLTAGQGSDPSIFAPYQQHWVTVPWLAYRVVFDIVGLRSYVPYLMVVVSLHLTVAVLLRLVMRRIGVRPWVATIGAGIFVFFGPGSQNIVWAFQIGFTGAVVFGLLQLIGADHDGPIDRRDAFALLAGLVGLMCSGDALAMVFMVAVAVVIRRGWKAAMFHTAPLAAVYGTWYLLNKEAMTSLGSRPPVGDVLAWLWKGETATLAATGHFEIVAVLLAVMTFFGLAIAWLPLDSAEFRRRAGIPIAGLLAGPVFFGTVALGRYVLGSDNAKSSRYIYVAAAIALPAVAVAADALCRWRSAAPIAIAVLAIGIPFNFGQFDDGAFNSVYLTHERALILGMAASPDATRVPRTQRLAPDLLDENNLTYGWLLDLKSQGKVPRPTSRTTTPQVRDEILLRIGVSQWTTPAPRTNCQTSGPIDLDPKQGDTFGIKRSALVMSLDNGKVSSPIRMDPTNGTTIIIQLPNLHLRFVPTGPRGTIVLCH